MLFASTLVSFSRHFSQSQASFNFLVMYPATCTATSVLFSSRWHSSTSFNNGDIMLSMSLSTSLSGTRFNFQKSKPASRRDFIFKFFSELCTSLKPTKHLPPLICRYLENRLSIGSDWNLLVKTNLYPSDRRYSIKEAVNARENCLVRHNFWKLVIFISCQASIHNAKDLKKFTFPSPFFAASPIRIFEYWNLEFDTNHQVLNKFKNSEALF